MWELGEEREGQWTWALGMAKQSPCGQGPRGPSRVRGSGHLDNLGLGDTTQACKQLQVLTACQQLKDGIRLRTVARATERCGRFLSHAEDRGQGARGTG